jgi:hypothetical protein
MRIPLFQRFYVRKDSGFRHGANEAAALLLCHAACLGSCLPKVRKRMPAAQDCLMRPIDSPGTSVNNYEYTLPNVRE